MVKIVKVCRWTKPLVLVEKLSRAKRLPCLASAFLDLNDSRFPFSPMFVRSWVVQSWSLELDISSTLVLSLLLVHRSSPTWPLRQLVPRLSAYWLVLFIQHVPIVRPTLLWG